MTKMSTEIRLIVLTMAASFAASFAYLWWQRGPAPPDLAPAPMRQAGARSASPPLSLPPPINVPAPVQAAKLAAKQAAPGAAPSNVLPANLDGPPLPVLVSVAAAAAQGGMADDTSSNQADILNTSEQPLAVTLIDVSATTQRTSSTQVLLAPNGQAHITANTSLPMESGDAVTLRSSGFRDMTQTVP